LNDAVLIWRFVRRDPVGKWLGIGWAVVAWFALTWLSVTVTLFLVALTIALVVAERKRRDLVVDDDLDDLI
jgi:hypothetical protein